MFFFRVNGIRLDSRFKLAGMTAYGESPRLTLRMHPSTIRAISLEGRDRMKTILLVPFVVFLLMAGSVPVTGAAAPPSKIVITPASFSEREGLLIVSQNQGFFRKHKLDVQLVLMPSAPIAFSALTAGESHFYYGTTSGTSLGAVLNGLDGVFVAGFINKLIGAFAVSKEIKTPNDLKGKQIGVASLGGGNWMFTMLAFDHWGLDPKRDNISFRIIGNTGVRAQSIASGIIGGSVLGYTFATQLRRDGYPILADLADLNIPFLDSGLYTRRSFVAQHPEVVENVLRALLEGITFIQNPENKNAVLKSLVQWLRLAKTEDAVEGYEFMRKLYNKRIYPTADGIRNSIRVLGTTNEKFKALKAEDLVDDRIVKKLEKDGAF
jgi:ABC-type nitrate/sulfonate/bicarbonate transport system substrate-binding protein